MISASLSLEGSRVPAKFEFVSLLAPLAISRGQPFSFKKYNMQTNFLTSTAHGPCSQVEWLIYLYQYNKFLRDIYVIRAV